VSTDAGADPDAPNPKSKRRALGAFAGPVTGMTAFFRDRFRAYWLLLMVPVMELEGPALLEPWNDDYAEEGGYAFNLESGALERSRYLDVCIGAKEASIFLAFMCVTLMEVGDPDGVCPALNQWTLLAYCTHAAFLRAFGPAPLPRPPTGAAAGSPQPHFDQARVFFWILVSLTGWVALSKGVRRARARWGGDAARACPCCAQRRRPGKRERGYAPTEVEPSPGTAVDAALEMGEMSP
jgi:hypothetical protein